MAEGDSVQDQIDDPRDRLSELKEIAQHVTLIGEALGLTRGMLVDLIEASDADPDDCIDDLDRLDHITQLLDLGRVRG